MKILQGLIKCFMSTSCFIIKLLIFCWRLCKRARNRTYRTTFLPIYTMMYEDNSEAEETTSAHGRIMPLVQSEATTTGKVFSYRSKLPYLTTISTIIFIIVPLQVSGCSEMTILTAQQSVCSVQKNGLMECVLLETTRISLAPQGQKACLLLKDYTGELMGTLTIEVQRVALSCQQKTEYFTRSFSMKHYSVKRCAGAGSCSGEKCLAVKRNSKIDELDGEANEQPGFTYCVESCGCWACGCFWCTAACHFYRTYAMPESDTVYEVFACPTWKYNVTAKIQLVLGKTTALHTIELTPGLEVAIGKVHHTYISTHTSNSHSWNKIFDGWEKNGHS